MGDGRTRAEEDKVCRDGGKGQAQRTLESAEEGAKKEKEAAPTSAAVKPRAEIRGQAIQILVQETPTLEIQIQIVTQIVTAMPLTTRTLEKMKDFDKTTATVATKDDKLRTTTRNLRIREDTAKYLLNLDVNSSFYDPKSRSMRDDPLKHLKEEEKGAFRGDNFVRHAGDAKQLTELMIFAWDSYKHGEKIHDTAQPTQALKMWQVFKQRSKDLKAEQQSELLEKYGGKEHMDAPRELIFSQNDNYVEYSRDGHPEGKGARLCQIKV